jgi:glutamyl-tRNA(Gln) amidotransferase subunit E
VEARPLGPDSQRRFDDLDFYAALGLKCGLEMHRQLDTAHKLFCRCPVRPYAPGFHAEILRHMRPTLSELGVYDPTALMEFKTKKEIVYRLNRDTVCTYEMDDAPPFGLNRGALERAMVIGVMLNLNLVDELHIARKQYLDGSIPTGFQRTTILGIAGHMMVDGRRIDIRQLGLEEDSCREVSDRGHRRTYMTDRLSIPLIEIVTEAQMRTPAEAARVGSAIRRLCHLSGVCRTGLGRARQDVNVSIAGGTRVEIKGVGSLRELPALVHYEALRQKVLLEMRDAAKARGIRPDGFEWTADVTAMARRHRHPALAVAWGAGTAAHAIVLRGCAGILATPTGPGRTFANEVSDRIRIIACIDRLPNMAWSDDPGSFELTSLFDAVRQQAGAGPADAVVVVAGPAADVATAIREVRIRMQELLEGVPRETRRSLRGGGTRFERVLPGPDRMYPDTDLPPIVLTDRDFQKARAAMPEPLWDKESRYAAMGLSPVQIERLFTTDAWATFEAAAGRTAVRPTILAYLLLDWLPALARRGVAAGTVDADLLARVFAGADPALSQKDAAAALADALGHRVHWIAKGGAAASTAGVGA